MAFPNQVPVSYTHLDVYKRQPPEFYDTGQPEYIGREVAPMTAYEIISIFIGILALLMSFGSLIVALLAFRDKEKSSSRKSRRK